MTLAAKYKTIRESIKNSLLEKLLVREIKKLPIKASGISEDKLPWIELENGYTFYGFLPVSNEWNYKKLYQYLPSEYKAKIEENAMLVAIDIVYRYLYPHMIPGKTSRYLLLRGGVFLDNSFDLNTYFPRISNRQKQTLYTLFTIKEGDIFIDVGPYIGYGAIKISELVKNSGRIIAVEADPECVQLLEKNIKENNINNVTIVHKAVWNKRGKISFYKKTYQENSIIQDMIPAGDKIDVTSDTLDNILADLDIDRVSFIRVTINAAEPEALEGMSKTLEKHKPRLAVVGIYKRDGIQLWKKITAILTGKGYKWVVVDQKAIYAWFDK
ncbi:MAG: FkbM family methyltransferase [Bacteroidetes bacterium]|nr:FkbM family methyltransferase [Bacteroidota bacterium]